MMALITTAHGVRINKMAKEKLYTLTNLFMKASLKTAKDTGKVGLLRKMA